MKRLRKVSLCIRTLLAALSKSLHPLDRRIDFTGNIQSAKGECWPRTIGSRPLMVRPYAESYVKVFGRQSTHPVWRLQFALKEIDHFFLLRRRHQIADRHKRDAEIVAMMHLIITAIGQ